MRTRISAGNFEVEEQFTNSLADLGLHSFPERNLGPRALTKAAERKALARLERFYENDHARQVARDLVLGNQRFIRFLGGEQGEIDFYRVGAMHFLANGGKPDDLQLLAKVALDSRFIENVRGFAAKFLSSADPRLALQRFSLEYRRGRREQKLAAINALYHLHNEQAEEVLAEAALDRDESIAKEAIGMLYTLHVKKRSSVAPAVLVKSLSHPNEKIREKAESLLADLVYRQMDWKFRRSTSREAPSLPRLLAAASRALPERDNLAQSAALMQFVTRNHESFGKRVASGNRYN